MQLKLKKVYKKKKLPNQAQIKERMKSWSEHHIYRKVYKYLVGW